MTHKFGFISKIFYLPAFHLSIKEYAFFEAPDAHLVKWDKHNGKKHINRNHEAGSRPVRDNSVPAYKHKMKFNIGNNNAKV